MFTRKDALEAIREKFPVDKTFTNTDYINGGTRTYVATPEKRLKSMIDLHEPMFDGLKEGAEGISDEHGDFFRGSVEHNYKNENGLW
jgi:hypothetical protein